jgi:hypothetical protein
MWVIQWDCEGRNICSNFSKIEVQKRRCGDGVWRIEKCPPSLNTHCFVIQRDSMKHYDTQIITIKKIRGIPNPCYDGLWFDLKTSAPIYYKLWFCADDLIHCVGGTKRIYCVNGPFVPSTCTMRKLCPL